MEFIKLLTDVAVPFDGVSESSKVTLDLAPNHVCIKVDVSMMRLSILFAEEHVPMHLIGKKG